MAELKLLGYYICEKVPPLRFMKNFSQEIISVSNCIGELHPNWQNFAGAYGVRKAFRASYRNKLKLTEGEFEEFLTDFGDYISAKKLDTSSRFVFLSDAKYFREKYFADIECGIVGVSTDENSFNALKSDVEDTMGYCCLNGEPDTNNSIGYDILGWDNGSFHSYLCNALQEEFPSLKINEIGLISNTFEEAAEFARYLCKHELGEPVEWIPVSITRLNDKC